MLNRISTGFFANCSASLPFSDTLPDSAIVTCIAILEMGAVTTTQNSSSNILFRSIAFTFFLYFGADFLQSNNVFPDNKEDVCFQLAVQKEKQ